MITTFDVVECKTILAVLEAGTFSRAAEKLHYTQSGVTHMMCRLEDALGYKLWSRRKGGVVPTKEAEAVLPLIRRLVEAYDELDEASRAIKEAR